MKKTYLIYLMRQKKKNSFGESGFSLIEAMVAVVILGLFATGLATLMNSANVQTGKWNSRIEMEDILRRLIDCANNSVAWRNTINSNANLQCLRSASGDCRRNLGRTDLFISIYGDSPGKSCLDTDPSKPNPYNSLNPNHGFDNVGNFCNSYGITGSNCNYRFEVTWMPASCPSPDLGPCISPNSILQFELRSTSFGFNISRTLHRNADISNNDWFVLYDRRPPKTPGGECPNKLHWNRRKFSTKPDGKQFIGADVAHLSSSGEAIILEGGWYNCRASFAGVGMGPHQIRVVDKAGNVLIPGSSEYSLPFGSVSTNSVAIGQINLSAPTEIRVEHWCFTNPKEDDVKKAAFGFPTATGASQTYGYLECTRRRD